MEYFYDQTGVAGFKYAEETYFYIKDAQANIIAILDSNGDIVVEYIYDAWGNHTVSGSNVALGNRNPFRYRSYYYDPETRLYFLKTRYYDPEIGRFISPDSIDYADPMSLDGLNLYAYCNNNPVMNVDPTGQFVISGSALAFGVALAGTALLAWIESTFHPIQNLVESIGDAIGDLINDISVSGSVNSSNSSSSSTQYLGDVEVASNSFSNIIFSKKIPYKPKRRGKRVKEKSPKEAEEAARRRGGGKPPRFHKGKFDKNGNWIGPHFHPGVREGHPFYHDHYFYLIFLLLGFDWDE